ncbi:GH92 family glycosyl hydrolase [Elizabethkingia sp. JS20170427COW]|uniref:GH92 family glycosyl hydrolase n=1 Tax=Elizabethkingia sp. JS20170427COW TaxID=2583851 RepID=UPI0011106C42|nr:GH92 family glycosyl hydrolase [Elizabethkingia sp. JS20170427COW]QCX54169.1 glycoside hydrolase family 92 protein [Elizabethkingia sp. JS20170427COW]
MIIRHKISALFLTGSLFFTHFASAQNYSQYIDPLIGTGGHGHTFPGASMPFGMVQLSPDNGRGDWDWVSGYHYTSDYIAGFSHMHLTGTGIGDWLDIAVMPLLAPVYSQKVDTRVFYSHKNEKASAGLYQVTLDNGISAKLTASERVGYHQYTFPKNAQQATIRLDLHHAFNWDVPLETEIKKIDDNTFVGKRISKGWANHQIVYFALKTSKPVQQVLWNGKNSNRNKISSGNKEMGVNAQLVFGNNKPVELKVALSTVGPEKALQALDEIPEWNFDQYAQQAQNVWEDEVSKIKIETKSKKLNRIFYSALYHTTLTPTLYSDKDGEYRNYKGDVKTMPDGQQRHTLYSLWDTFRAEHPLLSITQPDRYLSLMNSMLAFHDEYGLLPVWDLSSNETNTMTGYHAIPVLADAILKDLPGLDQERAYQAMLNSAFQKVREVPDYIQYGYVPQDVNGGSVTKTLEYAYDDYAISLVAKKLGKTKDYELFTKRAKNYKNLFDKNSGFMRAKYKNGQFVEPFDPFYSEHEFDKSQYIEGTAWQHSFFVPHDVRGLAKLFPSQDGLSKMLDALFVAPSIMRGDNVSPDASGFIGQYAHGNEPSHHIAYMYAYIGEHWKTQERVRQIIDQMYNDTPDGYAGNEDAGQMSAWAVWSMLGMYPANPVGGEYVFGSPAVDKAEIKMPSGKIFTIKAENNSQKNVYIQSVLLNGKPYDKVYITHEEMLKGGELTFIMGEKPNKDYGKNPSSWPISMEN